MEDFTIIPNQLFIDLASGEITLPMFLVMCFLHKRADNETGDVIKVRSTQFETASGEYGYTKRTFQKALKNCHDSGRLTSYAIPGSRNWYKVTINNWEARSGTLKGTVLRPTEIRDWRALDIAEGAERGGEDACENYPENAPENSASTILSSKRPSKLASKPTTTLPLEKDSLARPLTGSAEQASQVLTENKIDELIGNEVHNPTRYARGTLICIKEFLEQPYTARDEKKYVPYFREKFFANGAPAQTVYNKMAMFNDWLTMNGLGEKILTVEDWLHHWENRSGSERGYRRQFDAWVRSAAKSVDKKQLLRAAKVFQQIPEDEEGEIVAKPIEVEEL
jgi:hypothetical protein